MVAKRNQGGWHLDLKWFNLNLAEFDGARRVLQSDRPLVEHAVAQFCRRLAIENGSNVASVRRDFVCIPFAAGLAEVLARERAVLTLRFVDDWDMRRYCRPKAGWRVCVDIDPSEEGRTGSKREKRDSLERQRQ